MVKDVNLTFYNNHCKIKINDKSLYFIPKMKATLYVINLQKGLENRERKGS